MESCPSKHNSFRFCKLGSCWALWNEQEEIRKNYRILSTAASLELWLMGWAQHRWQSQTEMWMLKPDLTGLAQRAQDKSCCKVTVLLFYAAHHCSWSQLPGSKWSHERDQVRVTAVRFYICMYQSQLQKWTWFMCTKGIWQVDITQLFELSCCHKRGQHKAKHEAVARNRQNLSTHHTAELRNKWTHSARKVNNDGQFKEPWIHVCERNQKLQPPIELVSSQCWWIAWLDFFRVNKGRPQWVNKLLTCIF